MSKKVVIFKAFGIQHKNPILDHMFDINDENFSGSAMTLFNCCFSKKWKDTSSSFMHIADNWFKVVTSTFKQDILEKLWI